MGSNPTFPTTSFMNLFKIDKEAFDKSIVLARKRNVPEKNIIKNKEDIDLYFKGGNINGKK